MDFYRGDDRGPGDMDLRTIGFAAKKPALPMDGDQAREFLSGIFETYAVNDFAFKWRGQTPGFLISTAMVQGGGFQGKKYFYKLTIPDNELTLQIIDNKGNRLNKFPVKDGPVKRKYFLLFNNGSYEKADLIAFCHGIVDTKEATFLTTIPTRYIVGYRGGFNTIKEKVPFAPFFGPHRPRIYKK